MGAVYAHRQSAVARRGLTIIDEAHHIAANLAHDPGSVPERTTLGLTATPCRSDGRGLGNYFTTIVEGPQIPELIKQKHLVPTVYYAPADPDLKGVETRQGDYVVSQLADRMNRRRSGRKHRDRLAQTQSAP